MRPKVSDAHKNKIAGNAKMLVLFFGV